MQSVNCLTTYYLKKIIEIETTLAAETGSKTLIDVYEGTKKAALAAGLAEDDAEQEAVKTAAEAVQMNLTFNLRELVKAAAMAGKILVEIANPELVSTVKTLMTAEELKAAAKKSTATLTSLVLTLSEMLPLVDEMIDTEHVAEQVLAAAHKRREAQSGQNEPAAKAKPVGGAVTPFTKRTTPSQN